MRLDGYFSDRLHTALESYAKFATGTAWSVPHKMDLYDASDRAFGESASDPDAFDAFERIYQSLVSDWQVFRPHGATKCWPPRRIFDMLRMEFRAFSRSSALTLATFAQRQQANELASRLNLLAGIKPNTGYPTMAVSKFLHFFNPSLFPIYDTEVVGKRVFRLFADEYSRFCAEAGLDRRANGVQFLINYMSWGSALLSTARHDFIAVFVEWLRNELPPRRFATLDPSKLLGLDATAFEFVAIGAWAAEDASMTTAATGQRG